MTKQMDDYIRLKFNMLPCKTFFYNHSSIHDICWLYKVFSFRRKQRFIFRNTRRCFKIGNTGRPEKKASPQQDHIHSGSITNFRKRIWSVPLSRCSNAWRIGKQNWHVWSESTGNLCILLVFTTIAPFVNFSLLFCCIYVLSSCALLQTFVWFI